MTVNNFYDPFAPFYDLIYANWSQSIKKQAQQLDSIIRETCGDNINTIVDVSCGIGTQALGLAKLGYKVTASDISEGEIDRARREAKKLGVEVEFSVADMREAYKHHKGQFDVVISADNSVPHLLTDDDILIAFGEFFKCARPGGLCLITVRDYDHENLERNVIRPYRVNVRAGKRYIIFQVWEDVEGAIYEVSMYCLEDDGGNECKTYVMRSKYYAVGTKKLISLMTKAGFKNVERVDGRFFQPVIIGKREA